MNIYSIIFVVYLFVASIVSCILYSVDKKRAEKGQWRIKERTLLLSALLGGSVGAIFAMYNIRHKNRKWYFVATNFLSLILHVGILVCLLIFL